MYVFFVGIVVFSAAVVVVAAVRRREINWIFFFATAKTATATTYQVSTLNALASSFQSIPIQSILQILVPMNSGHFFRECLCACVIRLRSIYLTRAFQGVRTLKTTKLKRSRSKNKVNIVGYTHTTC